MNYEIDRDGEVNPNVADEYVHCFISFHRL